MPPRHAYWTILVDEQPTAFRSAMQEDLQPTFKRLKEKHASARMVWFQNGKVWNSRLDAQAAMRARGDMGRRGDARQGGGFRERDRDRPRTDQPAERRDPAGKLEWKPKGESRPSSIPIEAGFSRPDTKGRQDSRRSQWKPKDDGPRSFERKPARKPAWKPKGEQSSRRPAAAPRERREGDKLEWRPKGPGSEAAGRGPRRSAEREGAPRAPRRDVKPGAKRDKTWRPGGEHRDPRQKYKDAKKAKWTRFKQTIRKRWDSKQGKKKKDDE